MSNGSCMMWPKENAQLFPLLFFAKYRAKDGAQQRPNGVSRRSRLFDLPSISARIRLQGVLLPNQRNLESGRIAQFLCSQVSVLASEARRSTGNGITPTTSDGGDRVSVSRTAAARPSSRKG